MAHIPDTFAVLDRGSHVPTYIQVKRSIANAIQNGTFHRDAKLPSAADLAREFSVTSTTLNRAIQELKREGWVTTKRGSGIYAASGPSETMVRDGGDPRELRVPELGPICHESRVAFLNRLQREMPGVSIREGAPDAIVRRMYSPVLPCFASGLEDLTDILLPRWDRRIDDPAIAPFCHEGRLLASGPGIDALTVFLNEDLFDQCGVPLPGSDWTLADMLDLAARLHRPERGQHGLALAPNYFTFAYFVWQNGGNHFSDDGSRCTLDSAEGYGAIQCLARLTQSLPSQRSDLALFTQGRAAMLMSYGSRYAHARANASFRLSLRCVPEYQKGIAPVEANGLALVKGKAARESGLQFLTLCPDYYYNWWHGCERVPLSMDRARDDVSPATQPLRDALPFGRHMLHNVPPKLRTPQHDVAGHLLGDQVRHIVEEPSERIEERLRILASHMTSILSQRLRLPDL